MNKPKNIIYSQGRPFGAPLVLLRGGGTRDQVVKDFLKAQSFHYDALQFDEALAIPV